jgi:hypothetical protein
MSADRRLTFKAMRQHVIDICDEQEIIYKWCRYPYQAWARSDLEEVCIPPVKSQAAYATARHEIGHLLGRYQQSRDLMARERGAWRWAEHNALVWTRGMEHFAVRCLDFAAETSTRARKKIPELFV